MSNIPATIVKRLAATVPKFKRVLSKAKERDVNVAVNINLGFGGHNGVLILKKFEE